jgi:hypothetical protein
VWAVDAKVIYEGVKVGGASSYEQDVAAWKKKYGF